MPTALGTPRASALPVVPVVGSSLCRSTIAPRHGATFWSGTGDGVLAVPHYGDERARRVRAVVNGAIDHGVDARDEIIDVSSQKVGGQVY